MGVIHVDVICHSDTVVGFVCRHSDHCVVAEKRWTTDREYEADGYAFDIEPSCEVHGWDTHYSYYLWLERELTQEKTQRVAYCHPVHVWGWFAHRTRVFGTTPNG